MKMVKEELKYYVVLERQPMSEAFPKELQNSKYWYACWDDSRGFYWVANLDKARAFDTPEKAVAHMHAGLSAAFMVPIPGFSCYVVSKGVSTLFNLAEVDDEKLR